MGLKGVVQRAIRRMRRRGAKRPPSFGIPLIEPARPSTGRILTKHNLVAAVLGFLAALIVFAAAWLTWREARLRSREPRLEEKPPQIPHKTILFEDTDMSRYGFRRPPGLLFTAEHSSELEADSADAFCDKRRLHKSDSNLPAVSKDNLSIEQRSGGRILTARIETGPVIKVLHPHVPHGLYRTIFRVADRLGLSSPPAVLEFNYTYNEDFLELNAALEVNAQGFSPTENQGLEIINYSRTGGYVSATFKQSFDFKTDFCVSGFFTVESGDVSKPAGLDIALCDRWGERLAAIFADGHWDAYSIKVAGESYGPPVTVGGPITGPQCPTIVADGTTRNYFLIHVARLDERISVCKLYVGSNEGDVGSDPVHKRIIDTSVLGTGFTWIKVKLWKNGIVRLYDFEVAETDPRIALNEQP